MGNISAKPARNSKKAARTCREGAASSKIMVFKNARSRMPQQRTTRGHPILAICTSGEPSRALRANHGPLVVAPGPPPFRPADLGPRAVAGRPGNDVRLPQEDPYLTMCDAFLDQIQENAQNAGNTNYAFVRENCMPCWAAKKLLRERRVVFLDVDLKKHFEQSPLSKTMRWPVFWKHLKKCLARRYDDDGKNWEASNPTLPMIFLDHEFIGGFEDLKKCDEKGALPTQWQSVTALPTPRQYPSPVPTPRKPLSLEPNAFPVTEVIAGSREALNHELRMPNAEQDREMEQDRFRRVKDLTDPNKRLLDAERESTASSYDTWSENKNRSYDYILPRTSHLPSPAAFKGILQVQEEEKTLNQNERYLQNTSMSLPAPTPRQNPSPVHIPQEPISILFTPRQHPIPVPTPREPHSLEPNANPVTGSGGSMTETSTWPEEEEINRKYTSKVNQLNEEMIADYEQIYKDEYKDQLHRMGYTPEDFTDSSNIPAHSYPARSRNPMSSYSPVQKMRSAQYPPASPPTQGTTQRNPGTDPRFQGTQRNPGTDPRFQVNQQTTENKTIMVSKTVMVPKLIIVPKTITVPKQISIPKTIFVDVTTTEQYSAPVTKVGTRQVTYGCNQNSYLPVFRSKPVGCGPCQGSLASTRLPVFDQVEENFRSQYV